MDESSNRRALTDSQDSQVLTDAERPELEARVLDYFHQNSNAMDSADGVARFWVNENLRLVESCLLDLHRQGLLQQRTIAGTEFYSLHNDPQRPAAPETLRGRILIVDDDSSIRKFLTEALAAAFGTWRSSVATCCAG